MLIDYRYPEIITVQGGAGLRNHHRFKSPGACNLCLLSEGALAHQSFT